MMQRERETDRQRQREGKRERDRAQTSIQYIMTIMTTKAHKFISKSISLTFSVMLRYIFSHSVHGLTNVSNDDATLILVERLFQTTTPKYMISSLCITCILLLVIGNSYVLLTVN